MKNKMKKVCRFLSIGLIVATPAWAMPRVPTATAPKLPAGVSQADWQQVSQQISISSPHDSRAVVCNENR